MIYHIHYSRQGYSLPLIPEYAAADYPQETVRHPHGIDLYQWFLCTKGQGELVIDRRKSIVSAGQGFLLAPHVGHAYLGLTEDFSVDFISFRGPACPEVFRSLQMEQSGVYTVSRPAVFRRQVRELIALSEENTPGRESALSKAGYGLLLDLSAEIRWVDPLLLAEEDERLRDLLAYMEENYMRDLSLDELAEQVHLTKEYMCSLFRRSMNQTIVQHLQDIRIIHARILLVQYPEMPVREVGRLCGFHSPSYFGKVFRDDMGCSPGAFRLRKQESSLPSGKNKK